MSASTISRRKSLDAGGAFPAPSGGGSGVRGKGGGEDGLWGGGFKPEY